MLVFGESPIIKVLDFFLTFDSFDYSIAQISAETETKWETVQNVLKLLIKKGIVKKTRRLGKAQLYMLEKESSITKLLMEIDMKISDFFIAREMEKQKIAVRA